MRKILLLILILLIQFTILFYEANQDSATTDENVHLPAGWTYLKFHDFRFNPEHPPLEKMWSALPLLFQPLNLPTDFDDLWQRAGNFEQDTWKEAREFGEKFLYVSGNDADYLLLSGRLMTILLTLAVTGLVYVWSQKLWGARAGLVSAVLAAFSPLLLAHGKLTNTDISVTLFYLLSVWWLIKFLRSPGWKSAVILGIFFGLLQLSKYTAIIFLPTALVSLIYWLWLKKKDWFKELKKLLPGIGLVLMVGWIIITLAYFPQIKFFYSPDYIKGLVLVVKHTAGGHSSFLAGEFSRTGWWYYFPFAFAVKSSLITLVLLTGMIIGFFLMKPGFWRPKIQARRAWDKSASDLIGGVELSQSASLKVCRAVPKSLVSRLVGIFRGERQDNASRWKRAIIGTLRRLARQQKKLNIFKEQHPIGAIKPPLKPEHWIIIIAILVYFLSSMTSRANLGARHLLPIYPLIFVLLGWWGGKISNLKIKISKLQFKVQGFIILLLILFVADSLLIFPHHLTYFNQLIGTDNGYQYLLDSNYDWGQEIKRVARYQKEVLGGRAVYLDYWWNGDLAPDYYGIDYIRMLPTMTDISGVVIIGATSYMQPGYGWLRQYPIKDRIGNGVFVIELSGSPAYPADFLEQPKLVD